MGNFLPRRIVVFAALLVIVSGCGGGGPRVVKIAGTVTRDGKPVDKLMVNFWPDKGRPSWGITNQEGRFTLNYDQNRDGAVTGTHKVWFRVQATSPKEEIDIARGVVKLHPEMNAILQKYGESTSSLAVEVKEENLALELRLD